MAITDLQISDTIEAGAPSIKYGEGDIQRQVPENGQERKMAQQIWESLGPEQQAQFITFEQFYTSGAWKQILAQLQQEQAQQEQPMAYGGIAGLGGRRRYGLGSSIKKRLRKLIPNEVAQVASMAAPFVAPFNPLAGGLMSGLGGFDQHGSISRGLKSGLMTYGGGQLARGIGGGLGNLQTGFDPRTGMNNMGSGLTKYFSNPMQKSGGLGKMFNKSTPSKYPTDIHPGENIGSTVVDKIKETAGGTKTTGGILKKIAKFGLDNKAVLGILGASTAAGLYTKKHPGKDSLDDISRGEGMDIEGIRAEVIEAFKDPSGEKLAAIRIKYPFLGSKASKNMDLMAQGGRIGYQGGGGIDPLLQEEYDKYVFEMEEMGLQPMSLEDFAAQARAGKAQGGRIGYYSGGQSVPSDYTMEDARKTSTQDKMGGITDTMKRADLYRQGDVGQMYMAEGGLMDLGGMEKDYRNDGGFVPLGGEEKADDVPARLSKNEFVFTADAVRGAGDGDIDKGAEIMENIMKNLEQGGQISEETQGLSGAQEMFGVSERLSEVV